MPKIGMEAVRKAGLVEAAIKEIGSARTLDVTVSQIARRAGVSSALAHHYFGTKEQIFLSVMRQVLTRYGEDVRDEIAIANTPKGRVEAIIRASFRDRNFRPEIISAWLNFYVMAQKSSETERLLSIYRRRLRSNLVFALRPLVGDAAGESAEGIAAMIDGFYVRQSLSREPVDRESAVAIVSDYLDRLLDSRKISINR